MNHIKRSSPSPTQSKHRKYLVGFDGGDKLLISAFNWDLLTQHYITNGA